MTFLLRRATTNDTAAITALALRAKQSNGYDDVFMAACVDELTVYADDVEKGEFWLAESTDTDDTILCGSASLIVSPDIHARKGEISGFYIAPEWQRQGVGRLLWQKLRQRAMALGLSQIELDSDPNATEFYTRLGFSITGERPSGSIPGRVLPHMTLQLAMQE